MLRRENRLFKNDERHGYRADDKVRLDAFRLECQQAVENSKLSNLTANTTQKSYWKIIHRVMNKCRAPKIPPLLVNNLYVLSCIEKAKLFHDFFSHQCKLIVNNSMLLLFNFLTDKRIDDITIDNKEIN